MSIIQELLEKKFKNINFHSTNHFSKRERERGRFSNFILMVKNSLEFLDLKNQPIDFSKYENDKVIILFDEATFFKIVFCKKEKEVDLITVMHGNSLTNHNENDVLIKVNTRQLNILKENFILNEYKKKNKR
jgi:hypothetical protein